MPDGPTPAAIRESILSLTRNATISAAGLRQAVEAELGHCRFFYTELRATINDGLLEEIPIEGGGFKVTAKGVGA